jgi:hypothetical protein
MAEIQAKLDGTEEKVRREEEKARREKVRSSTAGCELPFRVCRVYDGAMRVLLPSPTLFRQRPR